MSRQHGHDLKPRADHPLGLRKLASQTSVGVEQSRCVRRRCEEECAHLARTAGPSETPDALCQPRRIPGKIEVHQHARILKIHALCEQVGGEQ